MCEWQVRAREDNAAAADDARVSSALEARPAIAESASVVELARARAKQLREQAHLLKSNEQVSCTWNACTQHVEGQSVS
jgi:hypothetical protein